MKYRKEPARYKPLVTVKQKEKRLAFAKKYGEWSLEKWYKVLFTDESTFIASDRTGDKVWLGSQTDCMDSNYTAKTLSTPPPSDRIGWVCSAA